MGTGKVLPTLVILSIAVMMVFSILPSYGDPFSGSAGVCPGGPSGNSPWHTHHLNEGGFPSTEFLVDENGNGHICHIHVGKMFLRDDRLI